MNLLFSIIDVLTIIVPVLMAIAFMTILERKQLAAHQRRVGPAKRNGNTLSWEQLSNSGNTLKLIVPSYILNTQFIIA
jgi:NADH-ubiquinone oxidoreductase chain 1